VNSLPSKYQSTAIDYVMLVSAIFVCLWAWIFVEPDTLQRSHAAQIIVKIVTAVLPWVAALERYGLQAHQLLLVHSVCYLIFIPLATISLISKRKLVSVGLKQTLIGLGWGCFFLAFFAATYFNLETTFSGAARRGGFALFIYSWSMPVLACLYAGIISYLVAILVLIFFRIFSISRGRND
jgi:hypothetical protein